MDKLAFDTWDGVVELDPIIDDRAIRVFSSGHCHSLAVALHELTSWPLWGWKKVSRISPSHVLVMTPKKRLLDIKGLRPVPKPTNSAELVPLTLSNIQRFPDYKPLNIENAKPFAHMILEKYVQERGNINAG
jgi:hypothetical protein